MAGVKSGRLTVLSRVEMAKPSKDRKEDRHQKWYCRCDCDGKVVIVSGKNIRRGITKSCGCLIKEAVSKTGKSCTRHGMHKEKIYGVWAGMIARCSNPKAPAFHSYGGRGIFVCDRWREKFENFYEDMGPKPENMTLDRIDVNDGYYRENCRWASRREQAINRRATKPMEAFGETKCLSEWAEEYGMNYNTLSARIRRGWKLEDALQAPPFSVFKQSQSQNKA